MIIVLGSMLAALGIGMGYGLWRDKHDPALEVSADIMNAMWCTYRHIPDKIWDKAVGKRNITQNENQFYWKEGWNLRKVILEHEIEKEVRNGELSGN